MTYQGGIQQLQPTYPAKEVELDAEGNPIEASPFVIVGIRGASMFRTGQFPNLPVGQAVLVAGSEPNRRSILLRNLGANDIYIGPDQSVTNGNGWRIATTDAPLVLETSDEIWAFVLTTSTLGWLVEVDPE